MLFAPVEFILQPGTFSPPAPLLGLRLRFRRAPILAAVSFTFDGSPVITDTLNRHNPFGDIGLEDAHALGITAGDAHVLDRATDQLPAVGHQHELVGRFDRE